jgi:MFS transporter, NNP family, nitrate/nitrite transporter
MNRYGSFTATSDGDNPPNNNEDEVVLLRPLASTTVDAIHEDQEFDLSCAEIDSLLPQQQPKYLPSPFEDSEDPLRRATALRLASFQRPHMRAFHGAHLLFCSSWIVWFSMAPLLPVLGDQLSLTKSQVWTSNVAALAGSVVLRLVLGPFCDQYGGRQILIGLLVVTALPCGIAGLLVHDFASLLAVRAWIGCVGATLVPVQVWLSSMFAPSCLGQVLGWATGWGAAGGGIAQVLMGSGVYPFCLYITNNDVDLSWRLSLVFPALLALALSYYFWHYSDDVPLGSIAQLKSTGRLVNRSAADSFRTGVVNVNAWILFCQFAACMGVELAMDSGLTLHLSTRFDLPTAEAAAYASIFGGASIMRRRGSHAAILCPTARCVCCLTFFFLRPERNGQERTYLPGAWVGWHRIVSTHAFPSRDGCGSSSA